MIREDGTSTISTGPFMDGVLAECSESKVKAYCDKDRVLVTIGDGGMFVSFPLNMLGSVNDVLNHLLNEVSTPA